MANQGPTPGIAWPSGSIQVYVLSPRYTHHNDLWRSVNTWLSPPVFCGCVFCAQKMTQGRRAINIYLEEEEEEEEERKEWMHACIFPQKPVLHSVVNKMEFDWLGTPCLLTSLHPVCLRATYYSSRTAPTLPIQPPRPRSLKLPLAPPDNLGSFTRRLQHRLPSVLRCDQALPCLSCYHRL